MTIITGCTTSMLALNQVVRKLPLGGSEMPIAGSACAFRNSDMTIVMFTQGYIKHLFSAFQTWVLVIL